MMIRDSGLLFASPCIASYVVSFQFCRQQEKGGLVSTVSRII